jgi:hypothetical protein
VHDDDVRIRQRRHRVADGLGSRGAARDPADAGAGRIRVARGIGAGRRTRGAGRIRADAIRRHGEHDLVAFACQHLRAPLPQLAAAAADERLGHVSAQAIACAGSGEDAEYQRYFLLVPPRPV